MITSLAPLPEDRTAVYQDEASWLRGRSESHRIGASEVAPIVGVPGMPSSWRGRWEIWAARQGIDLGESERPVMTRGRKWEPRVIEDYAEDTGRFVIDLGTTVGRVICWDHRDPWVACSPDGLVDEEGLVEAKTADWEAASHWGRESGVVIERWAEGAEKMIPPWYATQVYWQMQASGAPWVDLAVMLPHYEIRWWRVLRDQDTQDQLVDVVGTWRERHLVRGEEPEVDGSAACGRYLARKFTVASKVTREPSEEERAMVLHYAELKAAEKEARAKADGLRNRILFLLGESYGLHLGVGKGAPKLIAPPIKGRTTLSMKRLRDERPDLYAELEAEGLITTGQPSRQVRIYNL